MTDATRAPDELLAGLPDFPFEPRFRDWDGLRLAHIDEGDGPPVVFWHGEPTWFFLWRKVVPAVRDAGYRVICPDLPGFGRSDKPIDLDWYSYDRHTAAATALVVRGACAIDPGDDVIAAYDAPFPSVESKAGARAFPLMLPTTPDAPGASAGRRVFDALASDRRPALVLWADGDPILPVKVGEAFAARLGAAAPTVIAGASHFLQEDRGAEVGAAIAAWLA